MNTHAQTQPSDEEIGRIRRALAQWQAENVRYDTRAMDFVATLLSALEAERAARVRAEAARPFLEQWGDPLDRTDDEFMDEDTTITAGEYRALATALTEKDQ